MSMLVASVLYLGLCVHHYCLLGGLVACVCIYTV